LYAAQFDQTTGSLTSCANILAAVRLLREILGDSLTAVVAGVDDIKFVEQWAQGDDTPSPNAEQRIKIACQICRLLLTAESPAMIRAWFVGMNPDLDNESPALMLSKKPDLVLQAANSFLANG
jgi:hypothetical protein